MKQKIRWGILGCARIVEKAIIPAFLESKNGILYGIASRDQKRAEDWAKKYHIPMYFQDYQELIKDSSIDAIYIPLPNFLHAKWSIIASCSGKHVLCEKPMAMNAEEAAEMIRAASRHDVLLMEGFMYRFHPQIWKALDFIKKGGIGYLKTFHASLSSNVKKNEQEYRLCSYMGGGSLYDMGCYTISAARLFFGEEPISVFARAHIDSQHGVDMTTSILLEFQDGRFAFCDSSFESHFQSRIFAVGNRGTISLNCAFSAKDVDAEIEIINGHKKRTVIIPRTNMFTTMIEHFGECIQKKKKPRFPAEDALANLKVMDACFRSIKVKEPVGL